MEDDSLTVAQEPLAHDPQEDRVLGLYRWHWLPEAGQLVWPEVVTTLLGEPPGLPASWDVWLKHVHPADMKVVRTSLDLAGDPERQLTYRIILADGSVEWIEDRRHRMADGRWTGVFICLGSSWPETLDREAQRLADKVMPIAGIGIVFHDFRTGETFCNDTLYSLIGVDKNMPEARYEALASFVHPDDAEMFRRATDEGRRYGSKFDLDYRFITSRGETRWLRERGQYERAHDGQLLRYYGVIRDITVEKRRAVELNASRLRLKLALDANTVAVWEFNATTGQSFWSDEYYRLLGYDPRSVPAGRAAWLAALHPDDRGNAATTLLEKLNAGDVSEMTYRIIDGGRERWVRDNWSWGRAATGEALVCYGLTSDITDWKLKELRLIEAEKWLQLAVDASDIGIWEHDLETGEYLWNDRMFLMLEYLPGSIDPTSEAWNARVHPDDRAKVQAGVKSARDARTDLNLEYRLLLPGNVIRWVEERGRITFRGSSARHHGVMFDVSNRKALEFRLLQSSERLHLALETGEMGFWSGGSNDQNWDLRTFRILGLDPLSVRAAARNALRLVHPDDKAYLRAVAARATASGELVTAEYRIIRPDGALRWVESRFCINRQSAFGRYGVLRDITDRKAREEYYLKSQRLEAAGQLLGGIVHDFNNLLAVIAATLEQVERQAAAPEMAQPLAHAREAAHAGALFNRRLINLSQLRRQKPQVLNIGERIAAIMGPLTSVMRQGINVYLECPADLWQVLADPLDLESAVINLVINARDAMSGDGRIDIKAGNRVVEPGSLPNDMPPGEYVALTISDTGCGMDEVTLARATEAFFSTKPEGAGTGLGLTSVSAFAARSHGSMAIESRPGRGTSVSLCIPRTNTEREAVKSKDSRVPMGDGQLVLVVDDDTAVREATLQRVEALGYTVEGASSANDAIRTLLTVPSIAVVLTDIAMPGDLNGFGLRDWVAEVIPRLPVVLISAHEHFLSGNSGDAGPGKVLAKGCSRRELAQALACAIAGESVAVDG